MKTRFNRYSRLTAWAARRYRVGADLLLSSGRVGGTHTASRYSVIEALAAEKYLGMRHARRKNWYYGPVWNTLQAKEGVIR